MTEQPPTTRAGEPDPTVVDDDEVVDEDEVVDDRRDGDDLWGAINLFVDRCRDNEVPAAQVAAVGRAFVGDERPPIPKCLAVWPELIGRVGGLAFLAWAPGTEPAVAAELRRFLAVWADSPFCRDVDRFRLVRARVAIEDLPFPVRQRGRWEQEAWAVGAHEGNRYFVGAIDVEAGGGEGVPILEFAADGRFRDLPGTEAGSEERFADAGWGTPERILPFVEPGEPFPFSADAAGRLAAATGTTLAEAALLLAGFPSFFADGDDAFPPAFLTEAMPISRGDARSARRAWLDLDRVLLARLLDAAMPDDPADLAGDGFVDRVVEAWRAVLGRRVPIAPDERTRIERDIGHVGRPADLVALVSDPSTAGQLTVDGTWDLVGDGVVKPREDGPVFDLETLAATSVLVAYLHAEAPVGHRLAAGAGEAYRLARTRAAAETFLLGGLRFAPGKEKNAAIGRLLAGQQRAVAEGVGRKRMLGRDAGDRVALLDLAGGAIWIAARPAAVEDWDEIAALEFENQAAGLAGSTLCRLAAEEGLAAIAGRLARPVLPEGSWEANPIASAPELVDVVAAARSLEPDAAALYLMILTLAAPTDRLVAAATGWKRKRLRAAGEALAEAGLVVDEKRARAGRTLFLPGEWLELRKPGLPIEEWKADLYRIRPDARGRLGAPLGRPLPLVPLPDLFQEAWTRVAAGDGPGV